MIGPSPSWAKDFPHKIIEEKSNLYSLKCEWIYAIIMKESAGRQWASRFEAETYHDHMRREVDGRRSYFVRPKDFAKMTFVTEDTERVEQMTSWGLMQVMGFKARELGYAMELPRMCQPEIGIELGCKALRGFLDKYRGVFRHAALAYNAGSVRTDTRTGKFVNQTYLDGVLVYLADLGHTE